ncbi:hypothetical protein SJI45_05130 [Streptomyces sp. S399]|uniref:hypothetical protein n=1 Tax=Streptomyces sp. S399 TaxID=3096009 RepID=UPI002A83E722|nr:hypothetical protein [Streptomyces sp. S399]WPR50556.1 hypothetical protein SJI45_05130 [Streptomyces sp. S399]
MSRRVSLPGADELFRTTGGTALQASTPRRQGEPRVPSPAGESDPAGEETGTPRGDEPAEHGASAPRPEAPGARTPAPRPRGRRPGARPPHPPQDGQAAAQPAPQRRRGARNAARRPSGRERHDEKITVYVSAEELMDLEHARLVLRGEHGLAVDRGRIVREAVAVVLADLEARGEASILVRRLRGR